ncbi:unnamed protein product, partial [Ectocarpus sp. 6 AP-2014]
MDALAEGAAAVIVRASNLQGASQESLCYVEVTHEGTSSAGQTRVTSTCDASQSWSRTLTLPLNSLQQGHLKVSVCPGAPLDEARLAELAFGGKLPPAPLGFVSVPVADLAGLERSRPFTLEAEGGSPVARGPRSIDLGFTVVEDSAANGSGDGGKEPAHSSGIFSTSDFSVDPPLPVHSSSSSTRRSEPRARSEGAGELIGGGAGQFFGSGGAVQQQATSRSPRASYYGGVERDGGGSIASRSGTSSDNGGGGLLRVSG